MTFNKWLKAASSVPLFAFLNARRQRQSRRLPAIGVVSIVLLCLSGPVLAEVFHTVRSLLSEQFKRSQNVSFVRVELNGAKKAEVERSLGRPLPKNEYTIYVAKSGDQVDGYALFDEEKGEHKMIGFASFFDAHGNVTRTEVMAYREPYGDGIRSDRFRRQFVGRNSQSGFVVGRDIDAISGATISSQSMSRAVQRAALVLDRSILSK